MDQDTTIRPVRLYDAPRVAVLATQLGYPTSAEEMRQRLDQMNVDPLHGVFVAEMPGDIVGWIHVYVRKTLAREGDAEIGGLIVDHSRRGRGVGTQLIRAAASWAKAKGCHSIIVRSNVVREETARFYTELKMAVVKQQTVFRLPLDSG